MFAEQRPFFGIKLGAPVEHIKQIKIAQTIKMCWVEDPQATWKWVH